MMKEHQNYKYGILEIHKDQLLFLVKYIDQVLIVYHGVQVIIHYYLQVEEMVK